jgi:putative ABC transport system ATP-binding protein
VELVTATLQAENLYRFFHAGDEETLALQGVSLAVDGGEIVAVTGPSGSGKSTLLSCLAGLDEPDGGTVRVAGQRISRQSERQRSAVRAEHIGMLFQSTNLIGHLSLQANLDLARGLRAGGRVAAHDRDVLSRMGLRGSRPGQAIRAVRG